MPDTAQPITSPTDIERAIEAYLVAQIEVFKTARRQHNLRYIFANPAAVVSVWEGKIQPVGQLSFRVNCLVHVEIRFTDARGEEARRDGINPLIFAIVRILARKRFGLKITDLIPGAFKDVTTEDDFKNNFIVYDLEFSTSFYMELTGDEATTDLLSVALSYFLTPGDAVADAADTVSLPDQPKG